MGPHESRRIRTTFFFLSFLSTSYPPKGESVDSDAICSTFSTRDNFSREFSFSSFKVIRLKIEKGGFIFLFSLSTSTVFSSSSSFYEVSGQDFAFDLWVELLLEKEAGENFFFERERDCESAGLPYIGRFVIIIFLESS